MMQWRLRFYPGLRDVIHQCLPARIGLEALEVIKDLRVDPFPPYAEPLRRELAGWYKIKVDGWRIIYRVNQDDRVVFIRDVRRRDANTYLNL